MALDLEKNRIPYVVLAKIYTAYPGVCHRVATESVAVGTQFFDGRLLDVSPIRKAYPRGFRTTVPLSEVTLVLANPDSHFNVSLENNNFWAHRRVELFCWERGTDLTESTDMVFSGYVQFPGGVDIKDDTVTVRLSDLRERWNVKVPKDQFDWDTYPYMDPSIEGKPIPVLYGDFSQELSHLEYGVEAFCIDTGVRNGVQDEDPVLKVCTPTGSSIDFIGSEITILRTFGDPTTVDTNHIDLDGNGNQGEAGTFTLKRNTWSGAGSYNWQSGDRFFVQARGNLNATGQLIGNPAEVIRDLLLASTDAEADDLDTVSYYITYNYFESLGPYYRARRHVVTSDYLWNQIAQLAFETGIDLSDKNGKIHFQVWQPFLASDPSDLPDIDDNTIVEDSFVLSVDPEEVYANRLLCRYNWDSYLEDHLHSYCSEHTGLTTNDTTRDLSFDWQYYQYAVARRAQRLAWLFAQPVRVYQFDIGFRGLTFHLGERKRLSYSPMGIVDRDVQVRSMKKDLISGMVRVTAWDSFIRADMGRWAPPDAPNFGQATEDQKKRWGYWTDNAGLADPGNADSDLSKWI